MLNKEQLQSELNEACGAAVGKTFGIVFVLSALAMAVFIFLFELQQDENLFVLFFGIGVYALIWAVCAMIGQVILGFPLNWLLRKMRIRNCSVYCIVGTFAGGIGLAGIPFSQGANYLLFNWAQIGAVHGLVCAVIGWREVRHLPLPKDIKS